MNRKFVRGLLISFFVLFLLIILSLFVNFGKIAAVVYSLFFIELFFFTWLYSRKITAKLFFRHFIGFLITSFFFLLLAVILSLFTEVIPVFIYYLFAIDALVLIVLYTRKKLKKQTTNLDKIGYAVSILIPLIIIGYVVYMNFLPFGFEKTYVLDVGAIGDTTITKQIYLEKTDTLSEPIQEGEQKFRTLKGFANLMFKPRIALKDAIIDIEVIGDNVFIIPPKIEFDSSKYKWNLPIDFSKGIPDLLEGDAEFIDGCVYFDGQSSLSYPNSHNEFEEGPFAVYVEWTPENNKENFQQIVGHYNWELLQEKNRVRFSVGRMNNKDGEFYPINYPIDSDFFNNKHSVLAIYNPSKNGYIEFFVDNKFIERKYIGNDIIWKDYNENKPLTFGKSLHGIAKYYIGCIHKTMFNYENINLLNKTISSFYPSGDTLEIPVVGYGKIDSIEIKVKR